MGWEGASRGKGYVYQWPIHVDVWQKPTQHCKAIILQLKINQYFEKRRYAISIERRGGEAGNGASTDQCLDEKDRTLRTDGPI